ncbi:MAG: envelope stress response membrane protein PspC [Proteobacteria bacterium]|nr:envelope stress response membrane protein PspC [Pseudomonadota bacterium]MDA1057706.1 envelope stress response membrane protein PspC [Pseudomonadota bacterium]
MNSEVRSNRTRLYKNRRKGKVSGVCAGVADYLGISPTPLRVILAVSLITPFWLPSLVVYFLAAWILEDAPVDENPVSSEEAQFWKEVRREPSGTAHDLRHKFREIERRLGAMETHVTSSEFDLKRKFRDLGA